MGCAVVALAACSKDSEDVAPSTAGVAVTITSPPPSTATAEGNTGTAANADDLLANSTFTSTVLINFGSTIPPAAPRT